MVFLSCRCGWACLGSTVQRRARGRHRRGLGLVAERAREWLRRQGRSSRYLFCTYYQRGIDLRELLLIPLEDVVVFPNMTVTLSVDVGEEDEVLLVPVHEGSYADVGTVAKVGDRVRLPGGTQAVSLEGRH